MVTQQQRRLLQRNPQQLKEMFTTTTMSGQSAPSPSAPTINYGQQELRKIGSGINIKEKNIGALQSKIAYRLETGKNLASIPTLQQELDSELRELDQIQQRLGSQYDSAKQTAPKDSRTYLSSPPPNPDAGIRYSSPTSLTGGGITTTTGTKSGPTVGYYSNRGVYQASTPSGIYNTGNPSITGSKQGIQQGSLVLVQSGVGTASGGIKTVKGQYGNTPREYLPRLATPLSISETKTYKEVGPYQLNDGFTKGFGQGSGISSTNNFGYTLGTSPKEVSVGPLGQKIIEDAIKFGQDSGIRSITNFGYTKKVSVVPFGQKIIEDARERIGKGLKTTNDSYSYAFSLPDKSFKQLLFEEKTYLSNKNYAKAVETGLALGANVGAGILSFASDTTVLGIGGGQALIGEGAARVENLFRGQSNENFERTVHLGTSLPEFTVSTVAGIGNALQNPRGVGKLIGGYAIGKVLPGKTMVVPQEFAGVKMDLVGKYLSPADGALEFFVKGGNVQKLRGGGIATFQESIIAKEGKPYPLIGNRARYEMERSAEPSFLNIQLNSQSTIAEPFGSGFGKIVDVAKPAEGGGSIGTVVTMRNLFKQPGKTEYNLLSPRTIQQVSITPATVIIKNLDYAKYTPFNAPRDFYLTPPDQKIFTPQQTKVVTSVPQSRAQPQYGFPFTDIPRLSAPTTFPFFKPIQQNRNVKLQELSPAAYLKKQDLLGAQQSVVDNLFQRNEQIGSRGISGGLFFDKFTPRVLPEDAKTINPLGPQEFTIGSAGTKQFQNTGMGYGEVPELDGELGGLLPSPRIISEKKIYDVKTLFGKPQKIFGSPVTSQTKVRLVKIDVISDSIAKGLDDYYNPVVDNRGRVIVSNKKSLSVPDEKYGALSADRAVSFRSLVRTTEPVKPSKRIPEPVIEDLFVIRSAASRIKFDFPRGEKPFSDITITKPSYELDIFTPIKKDILLSKELSFNMNKALVANRQYNKKTLQTFTDVTENLDRSKTPVKSFVFSKEGSGSIVTGIYRPRDTKLSSIDASGKIPKKIIDTTKYGGGTSDLTKQYIIAVKVPKNLISFTLKNKKKTPIFSLRAPREYFIIKSERKFLSPRKAENRKQTPRSQIRKETSESLKPTSPIGGSTAFQDNVGLRQVFQSQKSITDQTPNIDLSGYEYTTVKPGERVVVGVRTFRTPVTRYYPSFFNTGRSFAEEPSSATRTEPSFATRTGLQYSTNNVISTKNVFVPQSNLLNDQRTSMRSVQNSSSVTRQNQFNIQKNIQSNIQQNVQNNIQSSVQKNIQNILQRSITSTKNIQYILQRSITQKPQTQDSITIDQKRRKLLDAEGFDVFLKRRKKFLRVASNLPRGRALLAGQTAALGGLGARFKLLPSGRTTVSDIDARINDKVFRSYKIQAGKRIPLKDEFIQRRGQRLVTRAERTELTASKNKGGRFLWR